MKIIATIDSENVLVQLTKKELESVTGISSYSTPLYGIFKSGEKPELDVTDAAEAITDLKGLPQEVKRFREKYDELGLLVTRCEKAIKLLPILSQKKQQD